MPSATHRFLFWNRRRFRENGAAGTSRQRPKKPALLPRQRGLQNVRPSVAAVALPAWRRSGGSGGKHGHAAAPAASGNQGRELAMHGFPPGHNTQPSAAQRRVRPLTCSLLLSLLGRPAARTRNRGRYSSPTPGQRVQYLRVPHSGIRQQPGFRLCSRRATIRTSYPVRAFERGKP